MAEILDLVNKLHDNGAVSARMPMLNFDELYQTELLIGSEIAIAAAIEAVDAGLVIAFDITNGHGGEAVRLLSADNAVEPIRAAFEAALQRLQA